MMRVVIPLADGVEEMEAVILIDVLRRAEWRVLVAGLDKLDITASRGVNLRADMLLNEVDEDRVDMMICPGGLGGTKRLMASSAVKAMLRSMHGQGKWVGSICAAAMVLNAAGVLDGRSWTAHPSVQAEIGVGRLSQDRVVLDGRVVTSQGPGTAFEFALALVTAVDGQEKAEGIAAAMVL